MAPDGLLATWPLPQSIKPNSWAPLAGVIPDIADIPIANVAKGEIKYRPAPDEAWQQQACPVRAIVFPT